MYKYNKYLSLILERFVRFYGEPLLEKYTNSSLHELKGPFIEKWHQLCLHCDKLERLIANDSHISQKDYVELLELQNFYEVLLHLIYNVIPDFSIEQLILENERFYKLSKKDLKLHFLHHVNFLGYYYNQTEDALLKEQGNLTPKLYAQIATQHNTVALILDLIIKQQ